MPFRTTSVVPASGSTLPIAMKALLDRKPALSGLYGRPTRLRTVIFLIRRVAYRVARYFLFEY